MYVRELKVLAEVPKALSDIEHKNGHLKAAYSEFLKVRKCEK